MERDIEYERSHIGYDCQFPREMGGGIKCKNFEICDAVLPTWWFECKGSYLCTACHIEFGNWTESNGMQHKGKGALPIIEVAECPVCLESRRSISQPRCEHTLCIECFKRCYYGDDSGEPPFPYPDIEDEYYECDDQENPKWGREYPLINQYNEEWEKWDEERCLRFEAENNLRACPVCRK